MYKTLAMCRAWRLMLRWQRKSLYCALFATVGQIDRLLLPLHLYIVRVYNSACSTFAFF